MRLGIWFAANAVTGMVSLMYFSPATQFIDASFQVGSLLAWGIGHIKSDVLHPWQVRRYVAMNCSY